MKNRNVNILKFRRALSELNALQIENNTLFHLLCSLSDNVMDGASIFKKNMHEVKKDVGSVFNFDDEKIKALSHMIDLTFLGLHASEKPAPWDNYAFKQAEIMLQGSDRLSIIGTAMRLSLERYDGTGPLNLESQFIPAVSVVYRALLCYAEAKLICKEPSVLCHELEKKLSVYVSPELLVLLSCAFGLTHKEQKIEWINLFGLRPGMTILQDVTDPHGVLLITKKTELNKKLIDLLLSYDQMQVLERHVPVIMSQGCLLK